MSWGSQTVEDAERQAKREEAYEQRAQQMLTELLGETVKVRNYRYKTMRQAVVDCIPKTEWKDGELVETGEYRPTLKWKDPGDARGSQVRLLRRLDVMTKDGWATVWDDGMDDLSPWERKRPAGSAKPTGKKYKSGML